MKGDLTAVNIIAQEHDVYVKVKALPSDKKKTFYSFATKYCSFHNPDAFPIYDSIVCELLYAYGTNIKNLDQIEGYQDFKNALKQIQEENNLNYKPQDFDKFLWSYGKELKKIY